MTNPWYFSYDDNLTSWIYLHLACYLTLVGTWMNLNLWDCNSLTSWAISTSPSLYTMVVDDKEAWNPSTYPLKNYIYIKFLLVSSFVIVILDTQVLFHAILTHVGRWTQTTRDAPNSWWTTSTLRNPHKFNYMIMINATTQGMLFHLKEALLQVMSQSNSTRCEYIKMLKQKMVTPFWA